MPVLTDTLADFLVRIRDYLGEPDAAESRWTDSFLTRVFNASYKRRCAQLAMAVEGAFINTVKMPVITENTVFTEIIESFDSLAGFTVMNATTTIALDATTKQEGLASLIINKINNSTATVGVTKSLPSTYSLAPARDLKAYLPAWIVTPANLTANGLRVRLGYDSSNYYEYLITTSAATAGAWNFFTINLGSPSSTVGNPNLANIQYTEYAFIFASALTIESNYRLDKLYIETLPIDINFYPWPNGFERLERLELELSDGSRIPLEREERRISMRPPNTASHLTISFRPIQNGFILEPAISSGTSARFLTLEYYGTPSELINDSQKIHSDFPGSFTELLLLDTVIHSMDADSLMENGRTTSVLRLRMEYELDWERYIDDRISGLRRVEPSPSFYEDA